MFLGMQFSGIKYIYNGVLFSLECTSSLFQPVN